MMQETLTRFLKKPRKLPAKPVLLIVIFLKVAPIENDLIFCLIFYS